MVVPPGTHRIFHGTRVNSRVEVQGTDTFNHLRGQTVCGRTLQTVLDAGVAERLKYMSVNAGAQPAMHIAIPICAVSTSSMSDMRENRSTNPGIGSG